MFCCRRWKLMLWVSTVIIVVIMLYGCRGLVAGFRVAFCVVVLDTGAVLGIEHDPP